MYSISSLRKGSMFICKAYDCIRLASIMSSTSTPYIPWFLNTFLNQPFQLCGSISVTVAHDNKDNENI